MGFIAVTAPSGQVNVMDESAVHRLLKTNSRVEEKSRYGIAKLKAEDYDAAVKEAAELKKAAASRGNQGDSSAAIKAVQDKASREIAELKAQLASERAEKEKLESEKFSASLADSGDDAPTANLKPNSPTKKGKGK